MQFMSDYFFQVTIKVLVTFTFTTKYRWNSKNIWISCKSSCISV